jgi:hypothetical protein
MYTSISYDLPRQNLPSDTVDRLAWLSRPSKHDPRTVPRVEVDPVNFQPFHYRFLSTLLIPSQRSADLVESLLGETRALSNQTSTSRNSITLSENQPQ